MKKCIFCSRLLTGATRAREHVIPRWLQAAQGIESDSLSAGFADAGAINITRQMSLGEFLAGHVCRVCNSGWMSQLETQVRKPLLKLLAQKGACISIAPDEKLVLAKWAIKTAIACNSVIPPPPRVDQRFVHKFDKGRSDNLGRCAVIAGHLSIPNRFGYIQTTQANPFAITTGGHIDTCHLAFYLDGLVILVAFLEQAIGYTLELVPGLHQPLWPPEGYEWRADLVPTLDGTPEDLRRFADALGIRYRIDF